MSQCVITKYFGDAGIIPSITETFAHVLANAKDTDIILDFYIENGLADWIIDAESAEREYVKFEGADNESVYIVKRGLVRTLPNCLKF